MFLNLEYVDNTQSAVTIQMKTPEQYVYYSVVLLYAVSLLYTDGSNF